jgi:phage terminase Nu1 subunit (DNA packaging protein)
MAKTAAALTSKEWRMVNRQQLAVLMGVAVDTVTHWAKEGMPVDVAGGRGKESQYDAVACLDWQRQRIGKNAKEAAHTRALTASAELNELKLAEQRGEVVRRDEVVQTTLAFAMAWRAKVLRLPRRLVQLAAIPRESEGRVKEACRELLEEISQFKTLDDLAAEARR